MLLGCGGGASLAGRIGARKLFMVVLCLRPFGRLTSGLPLSGVWLMTALGCFGAGPHRRR